VIKKTFYAGLGAITWKLGKRYMRRRMRGARSVIAR
jgi:hypothetical protein